MYKARSGNSGRKGRFLVTRLVSVQLVNSALGIA